MQVRPPSPGRVRRIAPLLAACSGNDDGPEDRDAAEAPVAAEEAPASPTPSPTATPTLTATVTATAAATPTTATLATIASPYESYHCRLDIEIGVPGDAEEAPSFVVVEGDFVAPDRHAFRNTVVLGGVSFSEDAVVIGDRAWARAGAGPWAETTLARLFGDGSADLTSVDPEFLLYDPELVGQFAALPGTPETLDGLETVRYELTQEFFDDLSEFFSPDLLGELDPGSLEEFTFTLWVDPAASVPVAAAIRIVGRLAGC